MQNETKIIVKLEQTIIIRILFLNKLKKPRIWQAITHFNKMNSRKAREFLANLWIQWRNLGLNIGRWLNTSICSCLPSSENYCIQIMLLQQGNRIIYCMHWFAWIDILRFWKISKCAFHLVFIALSIQSRF